MKPPSQPLPWSVSNTSDGFVVIDANYKSVARFREFRDAALVDVANDWHKRNKKRGRK